MMFNKIENLKSYPVLIDILQNILKIEDMIAIENEYKLNNNTLFSVINNNHIIGLLGVSNSDNEVVIKHIAVLNCLQKQGIGKTIVNAIHSLYPNKVIVAETDKDAVLFYSRLGFEIFSLGEKYPGVIRYKCVKK
ncbi:GNAT family N-acetyltransferase [Mammaliicoccus sciuri]|uniref:GNAT family N-acetyltransferase n=1 Tax=Mammaliicoccus sciuri TaxID=1296 RepID=UPI0034DD9D87